MAANRVKGAARTKPPAECRSQGSGELHRFLRRPYGITGSPVAVLNSATVCFGRQGYPAEECRAHDVASAERLQRDDERYCTRRLSARGAAGGLKANGQLSGAFQSLLLGTRQRAQRPGLPVRKYAQGYRCTALWQGPEFIVMTGRLQGEPAGPYTQSSCLPGAPIDVDLPHQSPRGLGDGRRLRKVTGAKSAPIPKRSECHYD